MLIAAIIFIVCFLLIGFFEGSETAFISLNKIRLKHKSETGDRNAQLVEKAMEKPERILYTTLVGTNIMIVTCSALSTAFLEHHFTYHINTFLWEILILTPLILIFCEIIPKSIFFKHSTEISVHIIKVIELFYRLFLPVIVMTSFITRNILSLLNLQEKLFDISLTKEDFGCLIAQGEEEGVIEKDKGKIITGVFALSETVAREVMTPRTDIIAVEVNTRPEELIQIFIDSKMSRLPVYNEHLDNIIGIIHAFDVLKTKPETLNIKDTMRNPPFFPESKKCNEILRELRESSAPMAILIDEHGGTAGLITIEDIMEELVGDISDEYDLHEELYRKIDTNVYIINARMEIDEINEKFHLTLPEGEFETLGGYLLEKMGKIPRKGDLFETETLHFQIISASENKVELVKLEILS
jgi:CBS domain containing-hemolysin-like protein